MTGYSCPRCGYKTDHIHNLIRHLQRKNMCQPILEDKDTVTIIKEAREKDKKEKQYTCEKCSKLFFARQSQSRHSKLCKGQMSVQKDVSEPCETTNTSTTHHIEQTANVINNNNITNNTFIINDFNSVNGKHIPSEYIIKLIAQVKKEDKYYDVFQTLLKKIYFDPKHPENHCIRIPNRRDKFCQVVTDGRIQLAKKAQKVDHVIGTTHVTLHDVYDENEHHPEISIMNRQVMTKMNKKYYDDDGQHMYRLREDTTLSILNNQNITPKLL